MYRNFAPIVIRFFVCVCMIVLLTPAFSYGQSTDSFRVRTQIGDDTTPPSIPTGLTATPIATSQIDLSWNGSTDDYELAGYHVWRDDTLIATTTSTAYADTGLVASTTYTYYVTAFDTVLNISASSTVVATTTLSLPPPAPVATTSTSSTKYGSRITPLANQIRSIEIFPQKDSVIIRYVTDDHIRSVIKWGRSSSYELGSLVEKAFMTRHETSIAGLQPGTTYQFTIEGENKLGRYGAMHLGSFTTLPPDDIFPPANVANLHAEKSGDDVVLTWDNPGDPDLTKVRVMRSSQFYPSDIADGYVVYEGLEQEVRDIGAVVPGTRQYYTVFSYDALGNISSGAVVSIVFDAGKATIPEDEAPPIIDTTKNEIALTLDAIEFIQEGQSIRPEQGRIIIDGAKQLTISIPYARLPEHLKTILVVLTDSADAKKTFKFLLRVNPERTAYTSTLAPLGVTGDFPVQISVFDFKTAQIGYVGGVLASHIQTTHGAPSEGFVSFMLGFFRSNIVWFVIFLITLVFLGRRLMRTES